jgi:K+-sensing histidine kinase KdpD
METKSSPRDLPPGFHSSGLPSSFEYEYGAAAAKAANEYCRDRSILGLRELAHELRTSLTSLHGAVSRITTKSNAHKQTEDGSDLLHSVRALNRFAKQLDDITFPGREVSSSRISIQQIVTEAYERVVPLLAKEGINDTGLKLHGTNFFIKTSRSHLQKALIYVIRSIVLSQKGGSARNPLNIRLHRNRSSATIEMHGQYNDVQGFHDCEFYINKHISRYKTELVGLRIAANYVAELRGSMLLASKGLAIRKAIIEIPLAR